MAKNFVQFRPWIYVEVQFLNPTMIHRFKSNDRVLYSPGCLASGEMPFKRESLKLGKTNQTANFRKITPSPQDDSLTPSRRHQGCTARAPGMALGDRSTVRKVNVAQASSLCSVRTIELVFQVSTVLPRCVQRSGFQAWETPPRAIRPEGAADRTY